MRFSRITLALVALLTAACDVHETTAPGALASLTLTPPNTTLEINALQQYTVVGKDIEGRVIPVVPTWTVAAGGGSINSTGRFTAGTAIGSFPNTVTATVGSVSATANVTVIVGPLASITVTPNPVTLAPGATQQYSAVGRDAGGNVISISPIWDIAAGGGSINAAGLFIAGGLAGTFTNTVRATAGNLSGSATVTIIAGPLASIVVTPDPASVAINATQQFTASGRDVNGNIVAISPVWSLMTGGGTLNATGLFTAGTVTGTYLNTIRATSGALSASATVIVTGGPLATITVTPNPGTMAISQLQPFVAVGRDASGNVVAITPVWSIANGGGTISQVGLFTAGTVSGTFTNTVRATVGAVVGMATVVVTPGALATIAVTPNPAGMSVGTVQQFNAVGRDASNNVIPITPVWSVVNGGGAINATGLFAAGAVPGTFVQTVRATSGAIFGSATVVVAAGPLFSITVTPNPASVEVNQTRQFTAVGRDASNNIIPITPVWAVVNGGGTIDANGLLTAANVAGVHPNTVRATSDAVSGFANLTVTAAGPPPFNPLGLTAPNGIMAGQSVSCISGGLIVADISIAPGSTLGLGACVQIGTAHLNDAVAQLAQNDLTTAYNTLAGLPCPPANSIVANLGGTTLLPGVYCTAIGIGVTGPLTLNGNGDPNAVFVFQAGSSLTTAGDIILIGQAQAKNVYWQVGSSATLGTASQWQGNILALSSITMVSNATLNGRALARNGSVTLGTGNTITLP